MRNEVWQAFFQALYPVWGIVGVLVAYNYALNANGNWRKNGGTYAHAGIEWLHVAWFVVWGCAHDVWCVLTAGKLKPDTAAFTGWGYSPGHLLQFFIMLSFFTSAIFGFLLINLDRSSWPTYQLVVTTIAVSCSIIAGLGHLFIAWRYKARRWRWTALILIGVVPVTVWWRLFA